jgi:hypothetical protein
MHSSLAFNAASPPTAPATASTLLRLTTHALRSRKLSTA